MQNERYYKIINSIQKTIFSKEETFVILILPFLTKRSVSVMWHSFKAATLQCGLIFWRCEPVKVANLTVEILSVPAVKISMLGVKVVAS